MLDAKYQKDKELVAKLNSDGGLPEFAAWMADLEREISRQPYGNYALPLSDSTGLECWFSFYESGYTAGEALYEDATNE